MVKAAIDNKLKRMPRTVRVGLVPGGLSEFITIQAAVDWCSTQAVPAPAAGGRYTVEVWPGVHAGPVVMADYVDIIAIGTREDTSITRILDADGLATVYGAIADLKGFKVISDGNAGAWVARAVEATDPGFRFLDCEFIVQNTAVGAIALLASVTSDMEGYRTPIDILQNGIDALNMNGGTAYLEDVDLGGGTYSVNMHTQAGTLHIHGGSMLADVITANAVIQTLLIDYCDLNGATFFLGATGACDYRFEHNTRAGAITDASLLGTGTIALMEVAGAGLVKNGTTPWTVWSSFLTAVNNTNAVGAITIYGGQVHDCTGSVGAVLWLIPELREYKVIEGMEIAHALADLVAGDIIRLGPGTFALAAQVARVIDDVTIRGVGLGTRITLDGVTPVITAGVQDGWVLADFDVDAGLVEIQFATNSTLHNITINGLHGTIINPDLGQTNFAGQPVIRLEEVRTLIPGNPIKLYDKHEYQTENPTFANPQFIMELLRRQARYMHVPINDLWTDGSLGTGSSTLFPQYIEVACAAAGGDSGLVYCRAPFLNSYVDAVTWDRVDFDNMIIVAFDVSRDAGAHADLRGRVQLKQAVAEGVLANDGFGIQIQNFAIFGEAFAAAQATVDLGVAMTALQTYRIAIVLIPNVSVDFYVNEVYRGSITAQVPTGPAAGTCYWVVSMDNLAQAVACIMRVSPISYWNHL